MNGMGRGILLLVVVVASLVACRPARAADPTTADCLAATEHSFALRNQHKLRDARAELLICSAPSCPADIRAECLRRVADTNVAIPTIVFEAKDASGNDLSVVKVSMDGQTLAEQLEGPALSIDPGVHVFTFETPGQPVVQKRFVIREGEKDRRERITIGAVAVGASAAPSTETASTESSVILKAEPATVQSQADSTSWGAQKDVGVVLGAAGVAGLATGVIFSLVYDSRAQAFNDNGCFTELPMNGPSGCQSRRDSVKSAEYVLVAGYASAAVLGGVGAYLFFTAPAETAPKVSLRSGFSSLRCLPSGDVGVLCGGRFW
jgi:hypothetical protein